MPKLKHKVAFPCFAHFSLFLISLSALLLSHDLVEFSFSSLNPISPAEIPLFINFSSREAKASICGHRGSCDIT